MGVPWGPAVLGVVLMPLVGVAVLFGHRGVGVGRDGGVVLVLVMPCPLALDGHHKPQSK